MIRLLTVDDESDWTQVIEKHFKSKGYIVFVANRGSEALEILKREIVDVVLLDLIMPGMTGEEVLLKITKTYPEICVLILSVKNDIKDAVETLRMGAYDHITKPIDFDRLEKTIEKGIEHQRIINELAKEKKRQDEFLLRLAHGLIHLVKNSLWLISGNTQLVERLDPSEEEQKQKLLDIIQSHADKSSNLLQEFLLFGRKLKDKREMRDFKPIELKDLIENTILLVSSFAWENKKVEIKKGVIEKNLKMNADWFLLQEVLINVIKNGVEAIEKDTPGSVIIDAKRTDSLLEINVKDNGIGIYEKDLDKVRECEPFFTTKWNGTGLGLCTSKLILDEHKGSISIYSELGKGTEVTIKLPMMKEDV